MSKATASRKVDYFRLPPLCGERSRSAAQEEGIEAGRQAEGVRQGCRQRHLVRAVDRMPVEPTFRGLSV